MMHEIITKKCDQKSTWRVFLFKQFNGQSKYYYIYVYFVCHSSLRVNANKKANKFTQKAANSFTAYA